MPFGGGSAGQGPGLVHTRLGLPRAAWRRFAAAPRVRPSVLPRTGGGHDCQDMGEGHSCTCYFASATQLFFGVCACCHLVLGLALASACACGAQECLVIVSCTPCASHCALEPCMRGVVQRLSRKFLWTTTQHATPCCNGQTTRPPSARLDVVVLMGWAGLGTAAAARAAHLHRCGTSTTSATSTPLMTMTTCWFGGAPLSFRGEQGFEEQRPVAAPALHLLVLGLDDVNEDGRRFVLSTQLSRPQG